MADDNEQMRAYHRSVLELIGTGRVREACDGGEAFLAICRDVPDLVITDYDMVPKDGIELTRAVRDEARSPDPFLPVIMVTAFTDKAHVNLARDAGVNDVLHKPVTPTELSHCIADAIDDPQPFIRTRAYFGPDRRGGRTVLVRDERRAPAAGATI